MIEYDITNPNNWTLTDRDGATAGTLTINDDATVQFPANKYVIWNTELEVGKIYTVYIYNTAIYFYVGMANTPNNPTYRAGREFDSAEGATANAVNKITLERQASRSIFQINDANPQTNLIF